MLEVFDDIATAIPHPTYVLIELRYPVSERICVRFLPQMGFEQHCKNLDLQVKQTSGGFNVIQTMFRRATGLPPYCVSAWSIGRN